MNKFIGCINESLDKVSCIGPLFLRVILGVSFFLFGYGKFPLPSESLVGLGYPDFIAILVPLVEVIGGIGIILVGFIGGSLGQFLTRVSALVLTFLMVIAIVLSHSAWLITADLFKNIQIYLLGVSLYFVFKPKN